jgi:hypothetical protein
MRQLTEISLVFVLAESLGKLRNTPVVSQTHIRQQGD